LNIDVTFDDFDDVPLIVAKALHEKAPDSKPWEQLDDKKIKKKVSSVKKRLNSEVVPAMTYDLLCKQDRNKTFEKLLTEIKTLCSDFAVSR
jgi:putative ATP-dependent endonuclease of OLD family